MEFIVAAVLILAILLVIFAAFITLNKLAIWRIEERQDQEAFRCNQSHDHFSTCFHDLKSKLETSLVDIRKDMDRDAEKITALEEKQKAQSSYWRGIT